MNIEIDAQLSPTLANFTSHILPGGKKFFAASSTTKTQSFPLPCVPGDSNSRVTLLANSSIKILVPLRGLYHQAFR
jgi:hypothetical protein